MIPNALPLIRPLFAGPLDIVGDVHGEIDALETLLARLGYDAAGRHPGGRRLVFVGDLIDKGPDSPAVLRKVAGLIQQGRAQSVMGNHELNLLLGKTRRYNRWFHRQGDVSDPACAHMTPLPTDERKQVTSFLAGLPLVLHREDLRVAHACGDGPLPVELGSATDALAVYRDYEDRITAQLDADGITDSTERSLALQNQCPVRRTTSGPEERAKIRFKAGGRWRDEARSAWWNHYQSDTFCVFGHYSRTSDHARDGEGLPLFPDDPTAAVGQTMCIDLGAGALAEQRRGVGKDEPHRLAALRWPEREVVADRP